MTTETLTALLFLAPLAVITALAAWVACLRQRLTAVTTASKTLTAGLGVAQRAANLAQTDAAAAMRQAWLKETETAVYRNEVEVESKLIVPLLIHLGYPLNQWQQRVTVAVPVGRNVVNGEADFVVYHPDRRVALIVEAKAPGVALDEMVQRQARSYAYALNAPRYLLANGEQLQLWQRGVERDELIVQCAVAGLAAAWEKFSNGR